MADTFPGSDFARVPPHNLDAERSALGGVLVKPVMFDELATTLGTDDFFLPAHREIFDAMMEISRRQQPIDVVSLGDELKSRGSLARLEGGAAYLIAMEMFDDNPELKGRAELIIGKNRHGPTADVPITFLSQYTRFENWAEEG